VRERFFGNTSPDRAWDTVVLGAGMGGLTAAAALSRAGQRVLVLERHWVPGGFTQTFKRRGWVWDVGVHAVGELDESGALAAILRDLTGSRLEWASMGDVYDEFHYPGFRVDFPRGVENFTRSLLDAFPGEREGIIQYVDAIREAANAVRGNYVARFAPATVGRSAGNDLARRAAEHLGRRTGDMLETFTRDRRLQLVLAGQWPNYGIAPARSSWGLHAVIAAHYLEGAYYPVGGSARIADAIVRVIYAAGGWTRINATVERLVLERGAVAGVRLANGEIIRTTRVVTAVGAQLTATSLLPPDEREKEWARSIARVPQSPAHVCLYLGLRGDPREAGATSANKWFYESWDASSAVWHAERRDAVAPILFCSFPSLKNPAHAGGPASRHTAEVVTYVAWELFERWRDARWQRRGAEYEALKRQLTERLLEQFLGHMPTLRPMVAHAELSTPVTTESFTHAPRGAMYGLEGTPERYANPWLNARTPVPGLYLAGVDIATVGVMGALMGGLLAAAEIAPTRVRAWLATAVRGATAR